MVTRTRARILRKQQFGLRQGIEDAGGRSFTFAPFLRYDDTDPRRPHFDLREAYFLLFGDIGSNLWELRAGVAQVFWGVTESQHLVDIFNHVDLIEHPTGESKLGQPMVHLTLAGDWSRWSRKHLQIYVNEFAGRQPPAHRIPSIR